MIHIDAHCDTGGAFDLTKFHHGGPFRNAVLDGVLDPTRTIQIGIRGSAEYLWEFTYESGMTVIHAEEVTGLGIPAIIEKARKIVGDGPTYLSFDIDSLDPAFAPGTGTPEIGGLTTREVLELLRGLKGVNLVGGDVVEVAPQYDATTNTAHAGAQVLFEILSLMVFSPVDHRQGGLTQTDHDAKCGRRAGTATARAAPNKQASRRGITMTLHTKLKSSIAAVLLIGATGFGLAAQANADAIDDITKPPARSMSASSPTSRPSPRPAPT